MITPEKTISSLKTLLSEVFHGTAAGSSWFLNPGDTGLLGALSSLSAADASFVPGDGRPTIAAHTNHILFHLRLLNRFLGGEANPFAGADWDESWSVSRVNETEWERLRSELAAAEAGWREGVSTEGTWSDLALTGAFGSAVHFAYHFAVIRQIVLQLRAGGRNLRSAAGAAVPCLRYRDAAAAIRWLVHCFGFAEQSIHPAADGSIAHGELTLGSGMVMIGSARGCDKEGEWGTFIRQPSEVGGYETQSPYLVVEDPDAAYRRVKESGAAIVIDIRDESYGGRGFACRDAEGHLWYVGSYNPWG